MLAFQMCQTKVSFANAVGIIPTFMDTKDPRPLKEQFDAKYVGGWRPAKGFHIIDLSSMEIQYPEDPPMLPLVIAIFREEMVYFYEYGFVLIMQQNGIFEIARMD